MEAIRLEDCLRRLGKNLRPAGPSQTDLEAWKPLAKYIGRNFVASRLVNWTG